MSSFDERKKGFEKKFAHDEEKQFKINARKNKYLGEWASQILGYDEEKKNQYIQDVIKADFAEAGDEDVYRKLYGDSKIQPQLTRDFLVSSNHVYVFFIVSILGLIAFKHKLKNMFIYLICISIVLEILHLIIPERGFELGDLFGNILGVFISFLIFKIIYKGRLQ